jgi:hypothetical protein
MAEALIYCGQKCTVNKYMMVVNGIKLIVRDNTIFSDNGMTSFHGAGQFLTLMFYEGIVIGADRDKILLYYNSLVNQNSFVTK